MGLSPGLPLLNLRKMLWLKLTAIWNTRIRPRMVRLTLMSWLCDVYVSYRTYRIIFERSADIVK